MSILCHMKENAMQNLVVNKEERLNEWHLVLYLISNVAH